MMLRIIENFKSIPYFANKASAGFPSPADDFLEEEIDLVSHLVRRPASTFVLQVTGDSMNGAGIMDDDYVVVDKSVKPSSGSIVVAILNGEMTIKYFKKTNNQFSLDPANPKYEPIILNVDNPPDIWGVVVGVVRRCV